MNLTIAFGMTSIALAVAVWHCYKANKPLRIKAREEAEAEEKAQLEKLRQQADEQRRLEVAAAVTEALKVLFHEARQYDHAWEESRKYSGMGESVHERSTFNRETREVFSKVLRVGQLEEDMKRFGNERHSRLNEQRLMKNQLADIHKAINTYT